MADPEAVIAILGKPRIAGGGAYLEHASAASLHRLGRAAVHVPVQDQVKLLTQKRHQAGLFGPAKPRGGVVEQGHPQRRAALLEFID